MIFGSTELLPSGVLGGDTRVYGVYQPPGFFDSVVVELDYFSSKNFYINFKVFLN